MKKWWRLIVWVALWLVPLPLIPNVVPLYWLTLLALTGWVLRVVVIFEPRWSIDDEIAELEWWT